MSKQILVAAVIIEAIVIAILALQLFTAAPEVPLEERAQTDGSERSAASPRRTTQPLELRARETPEDSQAARLNAPTTEAKEEAPPADPLGILLYGLVSDGEGQPIERARFVIDRGRTIRYGSTDEGGTLSQPGLSAGEWEIVVRADGFRTKRLKFSLTAGEPTHRLDVRLERSPVIKVKVVAPDGRPFPESLPKDLPQRWRIALQAIATKSAPDADFPMTEMRSLSRFGLGRFQASREIGRGAEKLPPEYVGQIDLNQGELPIFVSLVVRNAVIETQSVTEPIEELVFVLPPGRLLSRLAGIEMRVVDGETGEPIHSARVGISDRQSGGPGRAVDEAGRFVAEHLPPGIAEVGIRAQGYGSFREFIKLEPGTTKKLGDLRLYRPVKVSGLVLGSDGSGVSARIGYRNLDNWTFPQMLSNGLGRSSDTEGAFELPTLSRGKWLLSASIQGGGRGWTVVDVGSEDIEGVQIVIPDHVELLLRSMCRHDSYPLIDIRDARGLPAASFRIWHGARRSLRLPPGDYRMRVYERGQLVEERPLSLTRSVETIDYP